MEKSQGFLDPDERPKGKKVNAKPSAEDGAAGQELKCANCGRDVEPDWMVCPYCTEALKRVCPKCGKEARPEWKFCPYCSAEL